MFFGLLNSSNNNDNPARSGVLKGCVKNVVTGTSQSVVFNLMTSLECLKLGQRKHDSLGCSCMKNMFCLHVPTPILGCQNMFDKKGGVCHGLKGW